MLSVRGVNLGGWLVLERFIRPSLFALTSCDIRGAFHSTHSPHNESTTIQPSFITRDQGIVPSNNDECKPILDKLYPIDQWTLIEAFDTRELAREYLRHHWEHFVTWEDLHQIKYAAGLDVVRVPIGHWILLPDGQRSYYTDHVDGRTKSEPFIGGEWPYLQRLVQWCRELQLQIYVDLHTAPGSQNGFDNSGRANVTGPTCIGWCSHNENVERTLVNIRQIAHQIVLDGMQDVVTGFGVLNEPFIDCGMDLIRRFNNRAAGIVREVLGEDVTIIIGDLFNSSKWDGFWVDQGNTLLDSHYYHGKCERFLMALVLSHNTAFLFEQVSLVINFDLPTNRENYIHRIGRSGRFGRKGVAINFLTEGDVRYLRDIEQFYTTEITEMPMNVVDLI